MLFIMHSRFMVWFNRQRWRILFPIATLPIRRIIWALRFRTWVRAQLYRIGLGRLDWMLSRFGRWRQHKRWGFWLGEYRFEGRGLRLLLAGRNRTCCRRFGE
jgi:hypothetical protein